MDKERVSVFMARAPRPCRNPCHVHPLNRHSIMRQAKRQAAAAAGARRARRKVVALLVETSNDYARGLLRGVVRYVREHRPWSAYLAEHGRGDEPPDWLARWKGDGIIARIENRRIAKAVVACDLPVVDLSAANLVPGIPWVETDD